MKIVDILVQAGATGSLYGRRKMYLGMLPWNDGAGLKMRGALAARRREAEVHRRRGRELSAQIHWRGGQDTMMLSTRSWGKGPLSRCVLGTLEAGSFVRALRPKFECQFGIPRYYFNVTPSQQSQLIARSYGSVVAPVQDDSS